MRPIKFLIPIGLVALVAGCAGKNSSPSRDISLRSSKQMRVGVFNQGSSIDRTLLEQCAAQFPGMEVLDETDVHRAVRDSGYSVPQLLQTDQYAPFERMPGFELLLFAYRKDGKDYLKTVNYLGQYVSTVVLDIARPSCKDILGAQRLTVIDSVPPLADVKIDGRNVGETPRWIWLKDGVYTAACSMPDHVFKKVRFAVPKDTTVYCQRENLAGSSQDKEGGDKVSAEEGAGAALIYIVGSLGTIAAILLPILLFL